MVLTKAPLAIRTGWEEDIEKKFQMFARFMLWITVTIFIRLRATAIHIRRDPYTYK